MKSPEDSFRVRDFLVQDRLARFGGLGFRVSGFPQNGLTEGPREEEQHQANRGRLPSAHDNFRLQEARIACTQKRREGPDRTTARLKH